MNTTNKMEKMQKTRTQKAIRRFKKLCKNELKILDEQLQSIKHYDIFILHPFRYIFELDIVNDELLGHTKTKLFNNELYEFENFDVREKIAPLMNKDNTKYFYNLVYEKILEILTKYT